MGWPCGTHAAYQRHVNYGEVIDDACRAAHNARQQMRRARLLGVSGPYEEVTLTYLIKRDKGRCGICHKPVRAKSGPMRPSIDHIVPLSRGGTHELANVQLAHLRCNSAKGNRGGGEQLLMIG